MFQKPKPAVLVFTAILISVLSGCATIFSGTQTKVSVAQGNPSKAQVFLNGNFIGETPTVFKIPKKSFGGASKIEIKAEGYKPLIVTIDKRVQAGFIVLDLLTGLVELVVDFADGAIYTADPKTVKYVLEKL